jgi:hypothetical protein
MAAKPRTIRRCQHIKVNGEQCGSPALRGNRLCFFHNRWRVEHLDFRGGKPFEEVASMDFPVLEDANSIQVAVMQIMRLILAHQIDAKLAGLLLYALQTASANLRNATLNPVPEKVVIDPRKVSRVGLGEDEWAHPTPPPEELTEEEREKMAAIAFERFRQGKGDKMTDLKLYFYLVGDKEDQPANSENAATSSPPKKDDPAAAASPREELGCPSLNGSAFRDVRAGDDQLSDSLCESLTST